MERCHHAWMICARIVPEAQDRISMVEVLKCDRALADADRLRESDTGGFMTHVRAVGKIIGAVGADE
jgi:hypothetical protein